jgi:hypothetical protein
MAPTLQLLRGLARRQIRRHTLEMKFRHCARGSIGRRGFFTGQIRDGELEGAPQVQGQAGSAIDVTLAQ